jgi:hypothetical protein
MAKQGRGILRQIRDEAAYQLHGFPRREVKHQLRGFGSEAKHQLSSGWGQQFTRQVFGQPKGRRGR